MKKMAQWIVNGLLVLMISFGLFVALGPRLFDVQFMTVLGPSMSPTIGMGAVVVIQPVNAQNIQEGDVITFRSPENSQRIVTHRVIKVLSEGGRVSFHTQGDANDVPDLEPVPPNLILGRVMFHLPLLGYIVSFARKPVGFLLIIGIPALLIVIGEVRNLLNLHWVSIRWG